MINKQYIKRMCHQKVKNFVTGDGWLKPYQNGIILRLSTVCYTRYAGASVPYPSQGPRSPTHGHH